MRFVEIMARMSAMALIASDCQDLQPKRQLLPPASPIPGAMAARRAFAAAAKALPKTFGTVPPAKAEHQSEALVSSKAKWSQERAAPACAMQALKPKWAPKSLPVAFPLEPLPREILERIPNTPSAHRSRNSRSPSKNSSRSRSPYTPPPLYFRNGVQWLSPRSPAGQSIYSRVDTPFRVRFPKQMRAWGWAPIESESKQAAPSSPESDGDNTACL